MPSLTITLTDAQWAAYQSVSESISEADTIVWLKEKLVLDYRQKLELVDIVAQAEDALILTTARQTKISDFKE